MPIFERRAFIDILLEENNKIKSFREQELSKGKNKRKK
jgi:hypothetical protein